MKKKFLTVISIVLVLCQLLPVSTAAVGTLEVYPIIYMYKYLEGTDQGISSDWNIHTYQTTSAPMSFHYTKGGNTVVDDANSVFRRGVLFPINNTSNIEGGSENYLINFTMQIRPSGEDFFNVHVEDLTLDLSKLYINYGLSDERSYSLVKDSQGIFTYNTSQFNVFYRWFQTPYINDSDYNETDDYYLGTYNLHFTILLKNVNFNYNIKNIFFNVDFGYLCKQYEDLDFIIQPCQTSTYVLSDLDDIDSQFSQANSLISSIYALLDEMNTSSSASGASTTQILNNILAQDKIGYEQLEKANNELKAQVEDMKNTMDEKFEEGLENFKENIKEEVKAEVDKSIQDILDKVDVVDTSAAENSFNTLYTVITTDSKDAVLNVPEFRISLFGQDYVLWDSFKFDIPKLVTQMGADQYLIWFRFTFYFAFGWFLYGRANRMISIILLDDVHEQQANIRSQQQEYWKRKNGKG